MNFLILDTKRKFKVILGHLKRNFKMNENKITQFMTMRDFEVLVLITPEGKCVEIHIDAIKTKNVRIGFVDKNKSSIWRKEVWKRLKQEENNEN